MHNERPKTLVTFIVKVVSPVLLFSCHFLTSSSFWNLGGVLDCISRGNEKVGILNCGFRIEMEECLKNWKKIFQEIDCIHRNWHLVLNFKVN